MSTLTHTHVRRQPMQHRITVMETPEDQDYYGRRYDNYPDQNGNVKLPTGDHTSVTVPLMGLYLVEELESGVRPNGTFFLLTEQQFIEQFAELGEPGQEYGYRAVGGVNVFHHPLRCDIGSARQGLAELQQMHPLGKFELVARPAGSDIDWTVVGR
jgi:hypothetical protein